MLRQDFRNGLFTLEYVPSKDNVADIFTKNLGKMLFQKHRASLLYDRTQTTDKPLTLVSGG